MKKTQEQKKKESIRYVAYWVMLILVIVAILVVGGIIAIGYFTAELVEPEEPIEEPEPEPEPEFFLDGIEIDEDQLRRKIAQEKVGPYPFYETKGKVITWQEIVEEVDEGLVDVIFSKIIKLSQVTRAELDQIIEREDRVYFVTIPEGTWRINTFFRYGEAHVMRARRAAQDEIALANKCGEPILLVRCLNPVKLTDPPPPPPPPEPEPEPEIRRPDPPKITVPSTPSRPTPTPRPKKPTPSKPGPGPGPPPPLHP